MKHRRFRRPTSRIAAIPKTSEIRRREHTKWLSRARSDLDGKEIDTGHYGNMRSNEFSPTGWLPAFGGHSKAVYNFPDHLIGDLVTEIVPGTGNSVVAQPEFSRAKPND